LEVTVDAPKSNAPRLPDHELIRLVSGLSVDAG